MNHSMRWRSIAVLTVVAVAAIGCGNDKKDTGSATTDGGSTNTGTGAFIDPAQDCQGDVYKPTQGISGDTIKVGTVGPITGNYNIYNTITKGIDAYFKVVNNKGGVKAGDGKTYKLELLSEDDAYEQSQTPTKVKKLVEQDGVFALVGQIGTANALAVRTYLNDNCVPSVALATGSTEWGKADAYPWYIGGLPSYATEAHAFLEYLKGVKPAAKIAVLYQDDDFGKAYLATIEKEAPGLGMTIVDKASFDPRGSGTTEGSVAKLAGSGADTFFVGIGGAPCPATLKFIPASWKPLTYVSITCAGKLAMSLAGPASEGVYSTEATYDVANPENAEVPAVKQYLADGASVGLSTDDMTNGIISAGWGFASIFVHGLEQSKTVTRADLMNALYAMKDVKGLGLIRDDVAVNTDGAKDPWIIEGLRVIHRENGLWKNQNEVVNYDGKSNEFTAGS